MNRLICIILFCTSCFTNFAWSNENDNLVKIKDNYMHALSLLHRDEFETKQDLRRQQLKVSSLANEYFSSLKKANFGFSDAEFALHAFDNGDYANAEKFSTNALNSLTLFNKSLRSSQFFDLKTLNLKSKYLDTWHKKKAGKRIKSKLNISFFRELMNESIKRDDDTSHYKLEEDLIVFILDLPNIKSKNGLDIWVGSNVDEESTRLAYHKRQLQNIKNKKFTLEFERLEQLASKVKKGIYNFTSPGKSYFYLAQHQFLLGNFKIGREFMEQSIKYSMANPTLKPIFKMANLYMLNFSEANQKDSSPYWPNTAMDSGSDIIYIPFIYYDFGLIEESIDVKLQLQVNEKGYVSDIKFIDEGLDVYIRSFIEQIMTQARFSPYLVNSELKAHSQVINFKFNEIYNKPDNRVRAKKIQRLSRYYPKSILHFVRKKRVSAE